jgi:hypothetical protein
LATISYNKPARTAAINEIRRRLIEQNQPSSQIKKDLGLPERTFRRYRTAALKGVVEKFSNLTDEEVTELAAVLIERTEAALARMTALAADSSIEPRQRDSRIRAETSVLEVASILVKIQADFFSSERERRQRKN